MGPQSALDGACQRMQQQGTAPDIEQDIMTMDWREIAAHGPAVLELQLSTPTGG